MEAKTEERRNKTVQIYINEWLNRRNRGEITEK
jgi:hypothetical protein